MFELLSSVLQLKSFHILFNVVNLLLRGTYVFKLKERKGNAEIRVLLGLEAGSLHINKG